MQYEITAIVPYTSDHAAHFDFERLRTCNFGGFTSQQGQGGWKDSNGTEIIERVRVYTVLFTPGQGHGDTPMLTEIIYILSTRKISMFNQDAAYVTAREVTGGILHKND